MYQIIYYQTPRREEVVRNFTNELEQKIRDKVFFLLTLLREQGPNLKRPYADVVQGKIRELRVRFAHNQIRILYFFFHNEQIVLLNAFKKKEWAIDPKEIEKARQRMEDWIARNPPERLQ